MKITISFKHIEHTESLDEMIKSKSERLEKYMGDKTELKWTCLAKEGVHQAELKLIGPHFDYHASAKSDNLYKTFDIVINKIEKQISKKKQKLRTRIRKMDKPEFLDPENAWGDYEEDAA